MVLSLVAALTFGTSFVDLKVERSSFNRLIVYSLADGLSSGPSRWMLGGVVPQLSADEKAALTREGLSLAKAWLETDEGRKQWVKSLDPQEHVQTVPERSAELASGFTYWSTLVKERKPSRPRDAEMLASVTIKLNSFKADRARLDREAMTRANAAATTDSAAFKAQLKERLTYFLGETKQMPWDAKLVEANGKKLFVNPTLEGKADWWKFCWRAGPEVTNAAREFATGWLAELNAPPSKLSDDK